MPSKTCADAPCVILALIAEDSFDGAVRGFAVKVEPLILKSQIK